MRTFIPMLLAAGLALPLWAEEDLGAVAYHQALLDLGTDLRLMCVAAHPDDEDGSTLAMYRKKYGYKTFAVIATRGEGGQNEIGPELYNELGVLRTHEMAAAAAVTGAELLFLDYAEFGYSKSREEALNIWGHNESLERMVRVIRQARPDVIITHHGPTGGHGHHRGVGLLLQEAFLASADSTQFPEHLDEGLTPWQTTRLYVRDRGGGASAVTNDVGELDPIRGKTYTDIAWEALALHKSQGMALWDRGLTGRDQKHYALVMEHTTDATSSGHVPPPGGALFDGLRDRVDEARRNASTSQQPPGALLPTALAKAQADPAWNRLAAVAAGLRLEGRLSDSTLVPGQTAQIQLVLTDFGAMDASDVTFSLEFAPWFDAHGGRPIEINIERNQQAEATLPFCAHSAPSWTLPHAPHLFDDHFFVPQITAIASIQCEGETVELRLPLYVDWAPPMAVTSVAPRYLARLGTDRQVRVEFMVSNYQPGASEGLLRFSASSPLILETESSDVAFRKEGEERVAPVVVSLPRGIEPGDYTVTATLDGSGESHEALVRVVDFSVPGNIRVGVVQSYDDTFVTTLDRLHVPHEALTEEDFTADKLDEFTAIIVDIRAYMVRSDLRANNRAILDYVKRGGTALVMYQKTFDWENEYSPYPINLSRNRVTVEDAPITILEPGHPLFRKPNMITAPDWDGWLQERGLYFPRAWDERYTPLVATADPGEDIAPGSCLIAEYGEGVYFYTALGWYRQLRDLNPGSLRLFANMLAL
jgi:LmbE family N-acetylglucosaminyl deacetylase